MAHEIDRMAYVNEVPWHGLGGLLTYDSDLEQWQREAGLDWTVREAPVYYRGADEAFHAFERRKVLFRSDNGDPLSIVSDGYRTVQPREVLEFYRDLIKDFDFRIETAGSLRGGQRVWALANTRESAMLQAQDELRSYVLLATSYDTSLATTAMFTSVRVVCQNTLNMALGDAADAIKIGHHEQFNPTEVKARLGLSHEAFVSFTSAAEALTHIKLDAEAAEKFFKTVMQVKADPTPAQELRQQTAVNTAQTLLERFMNGTPVGNDLETARETAWGAVNTVTEYFDHISRERAAGNRLNSAWFGTGAAVKHRAMETALVLV
jgi:phage/plasmid-like protein (TIGR03299 family)